MVLHKMLLPFRNKSVEGPLQMYNATALFNFSSKNLPLYDLDSEFLKIRWYHPLAVHNGGSMWMRIEQAKLAAQKMWVGEPHVVHFCFMPQAKKVAFAQKHGLIFLGADEKSCVSPDKHFFDNWKVNWTLDRTP
jgi:hypothetical protein